MNGIQNLTFRHHLTSADDIGIGRILLNQSMPLFIGWISLNFPSGLVLYWVTMNIVQIAQQWWMYRNDDKKKEAA